MALVATTLAGAKATGDKFVKLTSGTGVAKKMLLLVDGEFMRVTDVSLSPTVGVVPGYEGSTAGPHAALAVAIYGVPSDFTGPEIDGPFSNSIAVNATYQPPSYDQVVYLTKATALAVTLLNPASVGDQNEITFIQAGAGAHVITYTQGFNGDTTGSDTATWPAAGYAALKIKAQNGAWVPMASAGLGVIIG
jgi:hypothetical protein